MSDTGASRKRSRDERSASSRYPAEYGRRLVMALSGKHGFLADLASSGVLAETPSARDMPSVAVRGRGVVELPLTEAGTAELAKVGRRREGGAISLDTEKFKVQKMLHFMSELPDRVARMMGVDRVVVGLAELVVMGPGACLSVEEAESAAGQSVVAGKLGTVVVQLPSAYKGGVLTVHHPDGKESRLHLNDGSGTSCRLAVFSQDSRWSVAEVTEGYRVAITCHVVAGCQPAPKTGPKAQVEEAVQALQEWMAETAKAYAKMDVKAAERAEGRREAEDDEDDEEEEPPRALLYCVSSHPGKYERVEAMPPKRRRAADVLREAAAMLKLTACLGPMKLIPQDGKSPSSSSSSSSSSNTPAFSLNILTPIRLDDSTPILPCEDQSCTQSLLVHRDASEQRTHYHPPTPEVLEKKGEEEMEEGEHKEQGEEKKREDEGEDDEGALRDLVPVLSVWHPRGLANALIEAAHPDYSIVKYASTIDERGNFFPSSLPPGVPSREYWMDRMLRVPDLLRSGEAPLAGIELMARTYDRAQAEGLLRLLPLPRYTGPQLIDAIQTMAKKFGWEWVRPRVERALLSSRATADGMLPVLTATTMLCQHAPELDPRGEGLGLKGRVARAMMVEYAAGCSDPPLGCFYRDGRSCVRASGLAALLTFISRELGALDEGEANRLRTEVVYRVALCVTYKQKGWEDVVDAKFLMTMMSVPQMVDPSDKKLVSGVVMPVIMLAAFMVGQTPEIFSEESPLLLLSARRILLLGRASMLRTMILEPLTKRKCTLDDKLATLRALAALCKAREGPTGAGEGGSGNEEEEEEEGEVMQVEEQKQQEEEKQQQEEEGNVLDELAHELGDELLQDLKDRALKKGEMRGISLWVVDAMKVMPVLLDCDEDRWQPHVYKLLGHGWDTAIVLEVIKALPQVPYNNNPVWYKLLPVVFQRIMQPAKLWPAVVYPVLLLLCHTNRPFKFANKVIDRLDEAGRGKGWLVEAMGRIQQDRPEAVTEYPPFKRLLDRWRAQFDQVFDHVSTLSAGMLQQQQPPPPPPQQQQQQPPPPPPQQQQQPPPPPQPSPPLSPPRSASSPPQQQHQQEDGPSAACIAASAPRKAISTCSCMDCVSISTFLISDERQKVFQRMRKKSKRRTHVVEQLTASGVLADGVRWEGYGSGQDILITKFVPIDKL